jgi:hypothetical protein
MLQFLNSAEEVGTNFKVMVMSLRNRRLESVGGGVFSHKYYVFHVGRNPNSFCFIRPDRLSEGRVAEDPGRTQPGVSKHSSLSGREQFMSPSMF